LEFKSFLGDEDGNGGRSASPALAGAANSRGYVRTEPSNAPFWSIDYYQRYFDVDTKTVLSRCYHSMIPKEDYVSVVLDSRPDLYGPFWTLTTVIFALFVFSSLASSITSYLSEKQWDYDFKLLSVAVGIVYAYGLGVPIALWAALKYLGVQDWGILDAVAVWGYGMTIWIPVSLLCIVPVPLFRWSLVAVASGVSGYFLLRNVYPVLASAEAKAIRLLVIVIAVLHLALALTFKILFFSYYIVREAGPKDPIGIDKPGSGNSTRLFRTF